MQLRLRSCNVHKTLILLVWTLLLATQACEAKIQQLESISWQPSESPGCTEQVTSHEAALARRMRLLRQHPAVHSLQDLGIWSTYHFGRLPASVAARVAVDALPSQAGALRRLFTAGWAAVKATVPHGGAPAVLMRHWWRLQCPDEQQTHPSATSTSSSITADGGVGQMNLRGLGTATVSLDWVYHHTLTPRLSAATTGIQITEQVSSTKKRSWTLPQSEVVPGVPSGWHVEARGLSTGRSYSLTSRHRLSRHSHSLDASQCSSVPTALQPGSIWSVITASETYRDMDLYGHLVAQHTDYHKHLGFTGAILLVTRSVAAHLLTHPAMQPGLQAGWYFIILWDGDVVPGTPYYHQSLWHNLALLATWGAPDIKLAFIDLDEFYALPQHSSIQEAFSSSGCLFGLAQARVMRLSAYYGITAHQAAACPDTRFFHKACQPQRTAGDIADFARLGWKRFFAQPLQYVDARFTIPESPKQIPHRWAHKSFVDPNYVAAYSIHEGALLLPGGGADSQHGVPLSCALGLHLVNMMAPRMYGTGEELHLNGSRFDMTLYVQSLLQGRQYAPSLE